MSDHPRIVAEQIRWWRAHRYLPADAWDAMGGSPLRLVITWDDVRDIAHDFLRAGVSRDLELVS